MIITQKELEKEQRQQAREERQARVEAAYRRQIQDASERHELRDQELKRALKKKNERAELEKRAEEILNWLGENPCHPDFDKKASEYNAIDVRLEKLNEKVNQSLATGIKEVSSITLRS